MEPVAEYSEEKVSKLKEAVLEALKNASNIRDVKSDEAITVCIFGSGGRFQRLKTTATFKPGSLFLQAPSGDKKRTEPEMRVWDVQSGQPVGTARHSSTMTIRVKKSDVDAFSKGKLNLQEFQNKAKVAVYAGPTISGAPFWVGGGGGTGGGFSYGFSR